MFKIIDNIIESKNIEWYKDSIRSKSYCGEFLLKFRPKYTYNKLVEYYFVLDESINNNFDFSVNKDYIEGTNNYDVILTIEGSTENNQRFAILGYEVNEK